MSARRNSPRASLWDRALAAVGLRRAPKGGARNTYAAAAMNRLNADWILGPTSPDEAVKAGLRALRDRARQLERDNPYARRYLAAQEEGIVGPHGVSLQARVPTSRGGFNEAANEKIEAAWRAWACEYASVDGRLSLAEMERLFVRQWKGEGEALVMLHPNAPNPFGFAVSLLDPDLLDETHNVAARGSENEIRMGVELDRVGRPVAYHLWDRHPNGPGEKRRRRVPAWQILHRFDPDRPGQSRGVTSFAPVMQALRYLDGIQEALLVLNRTAACKGVFLIPGEETMPMEAPEGQTAIPTEADPGSFFHLPHGYTAQAFDPGQPTSEYEAFVRSVLRSIAAGLNVSYATLTGDQSQANYGSQRVAMVAEREGYKRDQRVMIEQFYAPIYAMWLEWALQTGAVELPIGAPGDLVERYPVEWQPRGFDWIDPKADIDAAMIEVGAGLTSLTRLAAAKGRDLRDVLVERQREEALAKELGVTLSLGQPKASPAKSEGSDDDADDETDTDTDSTDSKDPKEEDDERSRRIRVA